MSLTIGKIEAMAPDQRSLVAAGKLRKPAKWPVLGHEPARGVLWGECQGSGSNPYRTMFDAQDLGYKCTCPSRKFPCKHVLALGWQFVDAPERFADGSAPDWVDEWMGRRRRGSARAPEKSSAAGKSAQAADLAGRVEKPVSPEEAERRAKAAADRAKKRHEMILGGLDAFDRWAADLVRQGVAMAMPELSTACRRVAKRLVDAKAGTFAGLVDGLPSTVFSQPEAKRAEAALLGVGALHLLAQAYRRLEHLPPPLAQDVRRLIGWNQRRAELLEDADAPRVEGTWCVIGSRVVIQEDDLQRLETWLAGDSQFAVLIDYHPVSAGRVPSPFALGDTFSGRLVFYPSAAPLRAVIEAREATVAGSPDDLPATSVAEMLDGYRARLAEHPWLYDWPAVVHSAAFAEHAGQGWLTDGAASAPLDAQDVSSVRGFSLDPVIGLWNGAAFTVLAARTPLGWWEP